MPKCISLERENFSNNLQRKSVESGIPPGPRKLRYKVAAKVSFRPANFLSRTLEFTLQEFFSLLLLSRFSFFFLHSPFLAWFFLYFPRPHHVLNGKIRDKIITNFIYTQFFHQLIKLLDYLPIYLTTIKFNITQIKSKQKILLFMKALSKNLLRINILF